MVGILAKRRDKSERIWSKIWSEMALKSEGASIGCGEHFFRPLQPRGLAETRASYRASWVLCGEAGLWQLSLSKGPQARHTMGCLIRLARAKNDLEAAFVPNNG